MPTIQTMNLPLPSNWQEFEAIVRDALSTKWGSPTLQKNGRHGQKQDGVDIYGPDYLGRNVGIQCKRIQGDLNMEYIDDEIIKAESFYPKISTLYIATDLPWNFHPAESRAWVKVTSFGAV